MNSQGIITRQSPYPVKETIDRLETFLEQHGVSIYARINQQAEVQKAGMNLLPLEFLLFGNPKAGGPLMIKKPLVALDLPLKVIAWQDDQNKAWISYNDGVYIENRYGFSHRDNSPLHLDQLISKVLNG